MAAVCERFADDAGGPGRARVVVLTFTSDAELVDYQQRRRVPFPILVDSERLVYDAYGLGRGRVRDVWGARTLRRYWQILRPSGPGSWRDLGSPTEDIRQLGGDVVIAPDGTVAWAHISTGPADRPTVDAIAGAVERAGAR